MPPHILYYLIVIAALFALIAASFAFFQIHTMEAGLVERFGKFHRIAQPGINFKWPFAERLVYTEDLSMQLMDVPVASKTQDDATVTISVRVQYYVLPDKVREAYYKLDDPQLQIRAHVENVILSFIPKLTLDQTYLQEDQIAARTKAVLTDVMGNFGYSIENALVISVAPAEKVVDAMNDINAARREQVAAEARGEADKILKVKAAEAEAESKRLQGEGIAKQRQAIIEGLKESVEDFRKATSVGTEEVMALVLLTQYFDMMRDIGQHSNTILLPNTPNAVNGLKREIMEAVTTGGLAASAAAQGRP